MRVKLIEYFDVSIFYYVLCGIMCIIHQTHSESYKNGSSLALFVLLVTNILKGRKNLISKSSLIVQ